MPSHATPKARQTRERIVQHAAQLIHRQGYHHTGLQQVLDSAGVTKGAFYFHFKDKKSLALAVIDMFGAHFAHVMAAELDNDQLSATERLEAFHRNSCQQLTGQSSISGCPVGNLTLELAAIDVDFQQAVKHQFEHMAAAFERVIAQGLASGEFNSDLPALSLADFLVNSWEGAMLRVKAEQSTVPMDNWFTVMKRVLGMPMRTASGQGTRH